MAVFDDCEHELIRFDDQSYRWIDINGFAWDGGGDDPEVLAALIASPRYRDTYLAPDSHQQDSETVHGPYRVAEITPGDFEGVPASMAEATVGEFVGLDESPPAPEVIRDIESVVLAKLSGAACYRLRGRSPGTNGRPSSGSSASWWRSHADAGEVALIVMAIDYTDAWHGNVLAAMRNRRRLPHMVTRT